MYADKITIKKPSKQNCFEGFNILYGHELNEFVRNQVLRNLNSICGSALS